MSNIQEKIKQITLLANKLSFISTKHSRIQKQHDDLLRELLQIDDLPEFPDFYVDVIDYGMSYIDEKEVRRMLKKMKERILKLK